MRESTRLELQLAQEQLELIERAAEVAGLSVTAFALAAVVERAAELVPGATAPRAGGSRPVGGWSFELPEGWDAPLDDVVAHR